MPALEDGDIALAEAGAEEPERPSLARLIFSKCMSCLPGSLTVSPPSGEYRITDGAEEVAPGLFACTRDVGWT